METAKREMSFLLARPERRILLWIAPRLPAGWTPDLLTGIGVLGAFIVGLGYALAGAHPGFLWIASFGLAVNWFGDSLDGTLARVRHIERPKYGYFLDHMVDAITTVVMAAGIGLSTYVHMEVALWIVIGYLCLSIAVYIESAVFNVFDLGFGIFGPTEMRILLILGNTGLFVGAITTGLRGPEVEPIADWVFGFAAAGMGVAFLNRLRINLIRLARIEPPPKA